MADDPKDVLGEVSEERERLVETLQSELSAISTQIASSERIIEAYRRMEENYRSQVAAIQQRLAEMSGEKDLFSEGRRKRQSLAIEERKAATAMEGFARVRQKEADAIAALREREQSILSQIASPPSDETIPDKESSSIFSRMAQSIKTTFGGIGKKVSGMFAPKEALAAEGTPVEPTPTGASAIEEATPTTPPVETPVGASAIEEATPDLSKLEQAMQAHEQAKSALAAAQQTLSSSQTAYEAAQAAKTEAQRELEKIRAEIKKLQLDREVARTELADAKKSGDSEKVKDAEAALAKVTDDLFKKRGESLEAEKKYTEKSREASDVGKKMSEEKAGVRTALVAEKAASKSVTDAENEAKSDVNKEYADLRRKVSDTSREWSRNKSIISQLNIPLVGMITNILAINANYAARNALNEKKLEILKAENKHEEAAALQARMKTDATMHYINIANELVKEMKKLVKAVRDAQREFALAAGDAAALKIGNFVESFKSFGSAIRSLGATAPVGAAEIQRAQLDTQEEFGVLINRKEARSLAEEAKELGLTTKQLNDARRAFLTQTMGDVSKAAQLEKDFTKGFEEVLGPGGAKAAFEFIGRNSELMARSGTRFQESLIRAAAEAKKIGVDLNKVNQVGDNIIGNFEGFLESMAELGAMGFNLDSTRLAQIAETGDTGALFQELQSQLAMTGKDLTNLRRSDQLALSRAFGMSIEELQRMAGVEFETPVEQQLVEKTNELLTKILEQMTNFVEAVAPIAVLLAGIYAFIKARQAIKGIKTIAGAVTGGVPGSVLPTPPVGGGVPGTALPPTPAGGAARGGMLERFFGNVKPGQLLAAGAAMMMVAASVFILAKAFQEFGDVKWPDVALGLGSLAVMTIAVIKLGNATGPMMKGAFAVALLSASLIPFAYAMSLIAGMDIKSVLTASAALAIFGGAVFALGALMTTGAGAFIFGAGLVALAGLGAAVAVFGAGLLVVGMGMKAISSSMSHIEEVIDSLVSRVGGIFKLSLAVSALAASLLLLGTLGKVAIPVLLALAAVGVAFGIAKSLTDSMGNSKATEGDDMVSRPGYGDRMLVTPNSTIALNNQDNVVAYADDMISQNTGIELLSKGAITQSTNNPAPIVNVDLSKLEHKLDELRRAMTTLEVRMDGNIVGRVVATSEERSGVGVGFSVARG